ncbi:MAG: hypothetical protein Q7U18_08035 [Methylobacter sp.]|nr:hypothetical protein [Methylobacter sp.]
MMSVAQTLTNYTLVVQVIWCTFLSAWVWAAITVTPAYFYGEEILSLLRVAKEHWYFVLPIAGGVLYGIYAYVQKLERHFLEKRNNRFLSIAEQELSGTQEL